MLSPTSLQHQHVSRQLQPPYLPRKMLCVFVEVANPPGCVVQRLPQSSCQHLWFSVRQCRPRLGQLGGDEASQPVRERWGVA